MAARRERAPDTRAAAVYYATAQPPSAAQLAQTAAWPALAAQAPQNGVAQRSAARSIGCLLSPGVYCMYAQYEKKKNAELDRLSKWRFPPIQSRIFE